MISCLWHTSLDAIADDITHLNALSRLVRISSNHKQNVEAANAYQGNTPLESCMLYIVRREFPNAETFLQNRLAASMTIRQHRLDYRRRRYHASGIRISNLQSTAPAAPSSSAAIRTFDKQAPDVALRNAKAQTSVVGGRATSTIVGTMVEEAKFHRYSTPSVVSTNAQTTSILSSNMTFPSPPPVDDITAGSAVCPFCFVVLGKDELRQTQWM